MPLTIKYSKNTGLLIILYISEIFKYISRFPHSLNISIVILSIISYELSNWLLVISF